MSSWETVATISGFIAVGASAVGILSVVPAIVGRKITLRGASITKSTDIAAARKVRDTNEATAPKESVPFEVPDEADLLKADVLPKERDVGAAEQTALQRAIDAGRLEFPEGGRVAVWHDPDGGITFVITVEVPTYEAAERRSDQPERESHRYPETQEFTGLVDALSESINDPYIIRDLALRAGFNYGHVGDTGTAETAWRTVLIMAEQSGSLEQLLGEVLKQFPNHELHTAMAAYRPPR